MCSAVAMCMSRDDVDDESRGVNRNFEQREASGSMMLSEVLSGTLGRRAEGH